MSHAQASGGRLRQLVWLTGRARIARPVSRRALNAVRGGSLALLAVIGSACYAYRPIETGATPGMHVSVDLNDRGRAALVDSLGGSVARVEGTIHAATDSSIELRVASVQLLNGRVNKWTNEALTIRREYTRDVRERRFSRSRTLLISAGAVGALVAFVTGVDLLGSGLDGKDRPGPPEPPSGQ